MRVDDFDYHLPDELIARYPADKRDESRMLVLRRDTGACELRTFRDFPSYLRPDDCIVVNDTRVIPARLFGRRIPTGGRVELLLLEHVESACWHCMLRPGRRLRAGARVVIDPALAPGSPASDAAEAATFTVLGRRDDGTFDVEFSTPDVLDVAEKAGVMPLPPYLKREATERDRDRYQTVYAETPGAVAAPTAGLHFTPELLDDIRAAGTAVVSVTLHVGAGTFRPVAAERIEDHMMHAENYTLPPETADVINATRRRGGRVIAVGTTSVRVLETCAEPQTRTVTPGTGRTDIFLHPPMTPIVPDCLLTNFHLPRSTLLMLVSTFSTIDNVLAAYRLAVRERLRFYSYGDCMLLL